jgi:hypothetical protein
LVREQFLYPDSLRDSSQGDIALGHQVGLGRDAKRRRPGFHPRAGSGRTRSIPVARDADGRRDPAGYAANGGRINA